MACKKYLLILLTLTLAACYQTGNTISNTAFGTICSITTYGKVNEKLFRNIFTRIHEIESLMSANIPTSDVSRINAAAGIEPVEVHEDTFKVLECAVYFAESSGGAFDPTIGPIVSLWNVTGDNPRIPSQEEIDELLPLVNWRDVEIDVESQTVFLKRQGMALDLGAIAKGYAADEAGFIIMESGIRRAIVNFGGDVFIFGRKRDGSPWKVGVQKPFEVHGFSIGFIEILPPPRTEVSIVTSGIYERYFKKDGTVYHHIFSPETGYPVNNNLSSVTIVSRNCMDADAISTAVFVLGYEKGVEFLQGFPEIEAVFVDTDFNVLQTSGADFTVIEGAFQAESTE